MKHLSETDLSAHLDRALSGADRARVDKHLRTCAVCQLAREALQAQDQSLAPHLLNDPGDRHLEELASRIDELIRVSTVKPAPVKREGVARIWHWLRTPVGVSWAGAGGVAVVGLIAVTLTVHEITKPRSGTTLTASTARVPAAGAPVDSGSAAPLAAAAPSSLPFAGEPLAEPAVPIADGGPVAANENAPGNESATPQHAVEMRRGANDEDQPVAERRELNAPAPTTEPAPSATEKGVVVGSRRRRAEPASGETRQSPATGDQDAADRDLLGARAPFKEQAPPAGAPAPAALVRGRMESQRVVTQRCGTVRDAAGNPIASAMLMVIETGFSVQSGVDGSFCMDLAGSARTIVAMAAGYQALRLSLEGASGGPLTLKLQPVVVGGGNLAGRPGVPGAASGGASRWSSRKTGDAASSMADGSMRFAVADSAAEPFASLGDSSLRRLARRARNLESGAALTHKPGGYDLAAFQWQRLVRETDGGPLESEARFRVAWARYQAWQTAPNHERSVAAIEAISSFVLRAPPGPRMDQAVRWLGQLRWSETKGPNR